MSNPTSRLTFLQLQTRVAEYLGVADYSNGEAAPPTDPHDLDVVKRLVNDGLRKFITYRPWNFLRRELRVTFVAGQNLVLTGGSTTTAVAGSIAGVYADDHFNGYEVTIHDTSTGEDYVRAVTDFAGATGTFTFAALPVSVAASDVLDVAGPRNVAGQPWRIYLPDDFYGSLILPFTYDENGPRSTIKEVNELEIRSLRATNRSTGTVSFTAFRPVTPTSASITSSYEAIFWPTPNATYKVTAVYRPYPNQLVNDTDYPPCPPQHDEAILHCALAQAELYRDDAVGIHDQQYAIALKNSERLDRKSTPARNIPYGDTGGMTAGRRPSNYYQVDSYDDSEV